MELTVFIDHDLNMVLREFVLPFRAEDDLLVLVNTQQFDYAWELDHPDFYIGYGGRGGIKHRYYNFIHYLQNNTIIEVPEVFVDDDGLAGFANGRHRFAVLRDFRNPVIPVAMSQYSLNNARKYDLLAKTPYRRNIDEELREAERKWKSSGSAEDEKRYWRLADKANTCSQCKEKEECQLCYTPTCSECDFPLHCSRCTDYICESCQKQCNQCLLTYCFECIEECPHCGEEFCEPGSFDPVRGRQDTPGCLPPGDPGHSCFDYDENQNGDENEDETGAWSQQWY